MMAFVFFLLLSGPCMRRHPARFCVMPGISSPFLFYFHTLLCFCVTIPVWPGYTRGNGRRRRDM